MKKISLSSPAVRISCVAGDVLLGCIAAVWLIFSFSWPALLIILLAAALVCFYTVQVFWAAVLVDREHHTITLKGLQARTDDVSAAAKVFTREVSLEGRAVRVIIVADENGAVLSTISTLNTLNHGYATEIAALELANALGAEFQATVPAHLYDKQARRNYRRQQREEERQARSRRKAGKAPAPEQPAPPQNTVNYDELDDEP